MRLSPGPWASRNVEEQERRDFLPLGGAGDGGQVLLALLVAKLPPVVFALWSSTVAIRLGASSAPPFTGAYPLVGRDRLPATLLEDADEPLGP